MAQKKNDMDGIWSMTHTEVKAELEKSQVELLGLRLALSTRQTQKSSDLQKLREKIARLKSRQAMLKREAVSESPKP